MISVSLALYGLWFAFQSGKDAAGIDFFQFWAGAQLAPKTESLYSQDTRRGAAGEFVLRAQAEDSERMLRAAQARTEFEFFSTPFLYSCFAPFRFPYDAALTSFQVLGLVSTLAAILIIGRVAGLSWPQSLTLLAFVFTLFQPMKSEIRATNVNQIQLLMAALAIWLLHRRESPTAAMGVGAVVAIAAAFKPNVALFVPLLAAHRISQHDFKRLRDESLGFVFAMGLALLGSSLYFRSASAWFEWLAAARELARTGIPRSHGNVSLILPLSNRFESAPLILAVLLVFAILAVVFRRRGKAISAAPLLIGLGLVCYLMSAGLVWFHYLLLTLPLAILLAGPSSRTVQRVLAVLALTFISADIWEKVLAVGTFSGEALLVNTGVVMLYGLGLWRLWDSGRGAARAPVNPEPGTRSSSRGSGERHSRA